MKISGFSFARNAERLGYPIVESIRSVLPICDEFVIAIGKGDESDRTRDLVIETGSPKIRIIDTEWTDRDSLKNTIYSQQTNIALRECTGDWCFYIQADEVLHEKFLDPVAKRCEELYATENVDGLLFGFRHFWGDYDHYQQGHAWYPYEIRVVRNHIGTTSIGDAQSFLNHGRKLNVAFANAEMFHYGYVRNPGLMQKRNIETETTYRGAGEAQKLFEKAADVFDYGPLDKRFVFKGTHPSVMEARIRAMDWKNLLHFGGPDKTHYYHDKFKYRFLTFLEQNLFHGRQIGGFKNYVLLKNI
jgi:glycosyltransferase involved in cell wall biosynthesis